MVFLRSEFAPFAAKFPWPGRLLSKRSRTTEGAEKTHNIFRRITTMEKRPACL